MAKFYDHIDPKVQAFIGRQHMFFTATAAEGARINLSPKGLDGFRVLDSKTVAYLDWTGSGNETAAHIRADGRLTIMMCAFEGPPNILRLYGRGRVVPKSSDAFREMIDSSFGGEVPVSARQIIALDIESVQTTCGFGVPVYEYEGERSSLARWAEAATDLPGYRAENNLETIDGISTGHIE